MCSTLGETETAYSPQSMCINTNGLIHAMVNVKIHIVTTVILMHYSRKLTLISSASDENPRP